MNTDTIAFIGLGHMNGAILAGLLSAGHSPENIVATTYSQSTATAAAKKFGVDVLAQSVEPEANRRAVADADVVVLGVNPTQAIQALDSLAPALNPDTVLVSVVAGIDSDTLAAHLPAGQPLVRTMPNVPLNVGLGAVSFAPTDTANADQRNKAATVFSGAGRVFEIDESQLDVATALAGSGPGYVFQLTHLLAEGATKLGLDAATAREMAQLMVAGSGKMLLEPGADAEEMRNGIMTPGGTTEAAINAMNDAGFADVIDRGLKANIARNAALGK